MAIYVLKFECEKCGETTYVKADRLSTSVVCNCGEHIDKRSEYKSFQDEKLADGWLNERKLKATKVNGQETNAQMPSQANNLSYTVRWCEDCKKYFYYAGERKTCVKGHPINFDKLATLKTPDELAAMRECTKLNKNKPPKRIPNTEAEEKAESIFLGGFRYDRDKVDDFHEVVYHQWKKDAIFKPGINRVEFQPNYLAYLNSFSEETKYKKIYKSKKQISLDLSSIADEDQRFYVYLHQQKLLKEDTALCWKIADHCVCYKNAEHFIRCYVGKDDYNLTRDQMQVMINEQTKKYFFFSQYDDDGGEGLNDLRFAALIMDKAKGRLLYRSLDYSSLDAFWADANKYDTKEKIEARYELISEIKKYQYEPELEDFIRALFNDHTPDKIYEVGNLEDIRLTDDDKNYVAAWKELSILKQYLTLCAYSQLVLDGKLSVLEVDFGNSYETLDKAIRKIVQDAYRDQSTERKMKKFAVLRLCFLSGIIELIDGADKASIGRMGAFFRESAEGSFAKILFRAYILTQEASNRQGVPFVYEGEFKTLKIHAKNRMGDPSALKRFWNNGDTQEFINYILFGNSGANERAKAQMEQDINSVYKSCNEIETKLNNSLDEINRKYRQSISAAEDNAPSVSTDKSVPPKTSASTLNRAPATGDNTNTSTKDNTNGDNGVW